MASETPAADAKTLMRIAVTDYIEQDLQWEQDQLRSLPVCLEAYQLKHASAEDLVAAVDKAEILIVNMAKMSRDVMKRLPALRLLIRHGAGYDNIDLEAATELGVRVCFVPDYCREEVAEQAMMLLLACYRRFSRQLECLETSVAKGQWDFTRVVPIRRFSRACAGIIGCGRIGSLVIRMLRGFDIAVRVHDPYLSARRQAELGITCEPLDEVLKAADMVTMHPALTHETYHMIGERELRLMKPHAVLVNTARGGMVQPEALARALREGWIAGAGIDVYETEPPGADFVLRSAPNVILTPHLAWYSEDSGWSIREKILEDIRRYLDGRPPRYPLNNPAAR